MDRLYECRIECERIQWLRAGCSKRAKQIFQKSFGMADREWSIPNTNQTKYRIGSVTKQFAAACNIAVA